MDHAAVDFFVLKIAFHVPQQLIRTSAQTLVHIQRLLRDVYLFGLLIDRNARLVHLMQTRCDHVAQHPYSLLLFPNFSCLFDCLVDNQVVGVLFLQFIFVFLLGFSFIVVVKRFVLLLHN